MSGLVSKMSLLTRNITNIILKSNMSLMSNRLEYLEHGDPVKVVAQKSIPLQEPKDGEVLVEMIAAPVNPADINTIQGTLLLRHDFILFVFINTICYTSKILYITHYFY